MAKKPIGHMGHMGTEVLGETENCEKVKNK
jgi:hypothetical protein